MLPPIEKRIPTGQSTNSDIQMNVVQMKEEKEPENKESIVGNSLPLHIRMNEHSFISSQSSHMHGSKILTNTDYLEKEKEKLRNQNAEIKMASDKLVEDWGFQKEETKKLIKNRLMKQMKKKNNKKKLNAEERYQKFMMDAHVNK